MASSCTERFNKFHSDVGVIHDGLRYLLDSLGDRARGCDDAPLWLMGKLVQELGDLVYSQDCRADSDTWATPKIFYFVALKDERFVIDSVSVLAYDEIQDGITLDDRHVPAWELYDNIEAANAQGSILSADTGVPFAPEVAGQS